MNSKKIEVLEDKQEIDMICLDDADSVDEPEEVKAPEVIGIDDLEEDVDRSSKSSKSMDNHKKDELAISSIKNNDELDLQEIINLSAKKLE